MSTPAAGPGGSSFRTEPWSVLGYPTGKPPVIGPAADASHHPTPLLVVQPWRPQSNESDTWPEWGTQGPRALVVLVPEERVSTVGQGIAERNRALGAAATSQIEATASPLANQIAGASNSGYDFRFVTLGVAEGIGDGALAGHLATVFARLRDRKLAPPDVPVIAVNYGTQPLPDLTATATVVDPAVGPVDMQIAGIAVRNFRTAAAAGHGNSSVPPPLRTGIPVPPTGSSEPGVVTIQASTGPTTRR